MMRYRINYCGIKDFNTKKDANKFVKKETYEIREYLKFDKKKKCFVPGQMQKYPYGRELERDLYEFLHLPEIQNSRTADLSWHDVRNRLCKFLLDKGYLKDE
jgi:hypothetical protein